MDKNPSSCLDKYPSCLPIEKIYDGTLKNFMLESLGCDV